MKYTILDKNIEMLLDLTLDMFFQWEILRRLMGSTNGMCGLIVTTRTPSKCDGGFTDHTLILSSQSHISYNNSYVTSVLYS